MYSKLIVLALVLINLTGCQKSNQNSLYSDISQLQGRLADDLEVATFAGGCFWCTEAVFEQLKGVEDVISGYTGGDKENPTYREVSLGNTRHAEGVQIYFDPGLISYPKLLEVFFYTHDPTTLNRQGPDVGPQYRSAIFYHNQQQKQQAEAAMTKLAAKETFEKPIVTELNPFEVFYPAEAYHQDYYRNNPYDPYVIAVAKPKVEKFVKKYSDLLAVSP